MNTDTFAVDLNDLRDLMNTSTTIDGVSIIDWLSTQPYTPRTASDGSWELDKLDPAIKAGKDVRVVDYNIDETYRVSYSVDHYRLEQI